MPDSSKIGAAISGAILGAFCLSVVTFLLFHVFGVFLDEFAGLYLLATVPFGAMLGMTSGIGSALKRDRRFQEAGTAYIVGGFLVSFVISWLFNQIYGIRLLEESLIAAIVFGLPFCLAILCILHGFSLLGSPK